MFIYVQYVISRNLEGPVCTVKQFVLKIIFILFEFGFQNVKNQPTKAQECEFDQNNSNASNIPLAVNKKSAEGGGMVFKFCSNNYYQTFYRYIEGKPMIIATVTNIVTIV